MGGGVRKLPEKLDDTDSLVGGTGDDDPTLAGFKKPAGTAGGVKLSVFIFIFVFIGRKAGGEGVRVRGWDDLLAEGKGVCKGR